MTTKADIADWLKSARKQKCSHLLVVTDTYDWEDYPVYVTADDNVHQRINHYNGPNMQKVTEVYSMALTDAAQLAEHRSWHV